DLEYSLAYLNREPVFHIRVNRRLATFEDVKRLLQLQEPGDASGKPEASENVCKELEAFDSFEVTGSAARLKRRLTAGEENTGSTSNDDNDGNDGSNAFYFQNTASQLVSMISARFAAKKVLDCCAAPGSKSITLALLRPDLEIAANDINGNRLKLLTDFCENCGLDNIRTDVVDAKLAQPGGDTDFIILDAPCSSVGTVRKNPDLKLKLTTDVVKKNAEEQTAILSSLLNNWLANSPTNANAGYFLYSVCTFTPEETENCIAGVLNSQERLAIEDLSAILDEFGFKYKKAKHGVYLLPDEALNNDLFYLALLKKD
ncbi:MAG: hypothetical protein GY757_16975, partial [bacterium]|nr:hypothetical protein [bacterium]